MWHLARRAPPRIGARWQTRGLKLQDFSPFVKKELRFDTFPRHPGGGKTLTAIVGANVGVWLTWQVAEVNALAGDEALLAFMETHFVGSNQGTSELGNLHKIWCSSFSHQHWGHLFGNMTFLLLLGPRLHEFLGRARFLLLYGVGSLGGTMATQFLHLDPAWEANHVAETPTRYHNLMQGRCPGQAVGLGASDSVSALFAAFYLIFPRQPVPFLWTKANLVWSLVPRSLRSRVPLISRGLRLTNAAAIWVLPSFFFLDFAEIAQRLTSWKEGSGLLPTSNVGHAAHVGGFLMGAGFYALVAHQLKAQYFSFTRYEKFRRLYVMTLSLGTWYGITRLTTGRDEDDGEGNLSKSIYGFTVGRDEDDGEGNLSKSINGFRDLTQAGSEPEPSSEEEGASRRLAAQERLRELCAEVPELHRLVAEATACSVAESCRQAPVSGRCGECDELFRRLRAVLREKSASPKMVLEALSPQMLDATTVCRHVLRTMDMGEAVHQDYLHLPPRIQCVVVPGQFSLRSYALGLPSVSIRSLSSSGLTLSDTALFSLELTHVQRGSPAERAGAAAFVGHNLTHVGGKRVVSLREADAAIRGCLEAKLWFEAKPAPKRPPGAKARGKPGSEAEVPAQPKVRTEVSPADLPSSVGSAVVRAAAHISL